MITNAQAAKILFRSEKDIKGNLLASGVEFEVEGRRFVVLATREVILSAGPVGTPQLLELSGLYNGLKCMGTL